MFKLIFIFTIIPLIELALLVKMSNSFGLSFIITLVTITGLLGGALTKHQGKETINKINDSLAQNQLPADNLMNGLLVLIGGVLLITPGVLTDIGGFTCLIPFSQSKIQIIVKNKLNRLIKTGRIQFFPSGEQEAKTIDIVKEDE